MSALPTRGALAERAGLAGAALLPLGAVAPTPLLDTYMAVMTSRIVMAATRLGVIAALDEEADDAAGIADRCGIDPDGTAELLYALAALGYVSRRADGRFEPTATARRWLAPCAPLGRFVGEFVYATWDHFSRLEDVLRGAPAIGLHDRPAHDPYWERYQRAMLALSRVSGPAVARAIPVRDPKRLLDIGGGPGGHSIAMCRRHPRLRATVVDLEGAARHGREFVALEGLGDRIEYRTGDALEIDLGSDYDVVTMHSMLHNLPPERCAALVDRAHAALRPGGVVAVLELERAPDERVGTRLSGAASVLMWLLQGTRLYGVDEVTGWLRTAGFSGVRVRRPASLPGSFVAVARR